jgi:hypothetical protein
MFNTGTPICGIGVYAGRENFSNEKHPITFISVFGKPSQDGSDILEDTDLGHGCATNCRGHH